jgi:predicted exporter
MNVAFEAKMLVWSFFHDEEGDVNIVSMVVLIGIAVLLAVFFRTQIQSLLQTLFGTITGNATSAVGGGE